MTTLANANASKMWMANELTFMTVKPRIHATAKMTASKMNMSSLHTIAIAVS
jgi:hypothetical protein